MTAVAPSVCALTQLQHLELGCANVTAVPDGLGDLIGLKSLIINAETPPASLAQLKELEYFEIQHALVTLPDSLLGGLSKLRTLDLGHCMCLKAVPSAIGALAPTLED